MASKPHLTKSQGKKSRAMRHLKRSATLRAQRYAVTLPKVTKA